MTNLFMDFLNKHILEGVTERQLRIAMYRKKDVFGLWELKNEKTLAEIGELEGVSPERIRQIIRSVTRKVNFRIANIQRKIGEPQVIIKYIEKKQSEKVSNLPIVYKPVEALGEMSVRILNCLRNEDIYTIEQLIKKKEYELLTVPNFGRKSLNELKALLQNENLTFGMEIDTGEQSASQD